MKLLIVTAVPPCGAGAAGADVVPADAAVEPGVGVAGPALPWPTMPGVMVTDPKLIDGGAAVDGCDPEQPETSRTAAAPTAAAGNAADIR